MMSLSKYASHPDIYFNPCRARQILPIIHFMASVTKVMLLHFIHTLLGVTKVSATILLQKFCNFCMHFYYSEIALNRYCDPTVQLGFS